MMKKIFLTLFITMIIFGVVGTSMVLAQDQGFDELVEDQMGALEKIGLPGSETSDRPIWIVIFVIKALLGLMALIFMILILIAGFRWMTSAGNTEIIEQARKTITSAAIGIMIIFLAYAITIFVFRTVMGGVLLW